MFSFSIEMIRPSDNKWGTNDEFGNFSGTVGVLQHDLADFSMLLSWSSTRIKAIEFTRAYSKEPLILISLKPQPLPQFLSLIRPFQCNLHFS